MKTFTFNGVNSNDFFYVNKIRRSILPMIFRNTRNLPHKHGEILHGTELGVTEIIIDVTFFGASFADLRSVVRQIAKTYYTEEPKELFFSDEPDVYYNALLTGATQIEQIIDHGEGSLIFHAYDPFAYSVTERKANIFNKGGFVSNNGTAETFPKVRITPTSDTNTINVTKSDTGESIILQKPQGDVFSANQTIIVDTEKNYAYLEDTNQSVMTSLSLETKLFSLDPEDNQISVFVVSPDTNLIPFPNVNPDTTPFEWLDWYGNCVFSLVQWKDGSDALRMEVTDTTEGRIRVLASMNNMIDMVAGQSYTIYAKIKAEPHFEYLSYKSITVYDNGTLVDGYYSPSISLSDMPFYDKENNIYNFQHTFTANHTAQGRLSLGFNTDQNTISVGDAMEIQDIRIEPEKGANVRFDFRERYL